MLLTTSEELRLFSPSHAVDHVETLAGFITNSEHDFLRQPLGRPLYDRLCEHYRTMADGGQIADYIDRIQRGDLDRQYYLQLLQLAQRCVVFDALVAYVDVNGISLNNSGVNYAISDDYPRADRDGINAAKNAYAKEAHKALNQLLETLEQWTQDCPAPEDATDDDADLLEIVGFWRSSRYFYLAAQLLIPSATVLQEYLNIYDSREKFIQMLPDLHFIQEEQIAPVIGEDLTERLVTLQLRGGTKRDATAATAALPVTLADDTAIPPMLRRILHKLRKVMATFLEGRTVVVRIDKDRRIAARDEGVRLLGSLREYCQQHQQDILRDLDTAASLTPRAVALLTPTEIEALLHDEDPARALTPELLQQYLNAEQPYTASPYFVAPADSATEHTGSDPSVGTTGGLTPACGCQSATNRPDGLLVTPPLL